MKHKITTVYNHTPTETVNKLCRGVECSYRLDCLRCVETLNELALNNEIQILNLNIQNLYTLAIDNNLKDSKDYSCKYYKPYMGLYIIDLLEPFKPSENFIDIFIGASAKKKE